CITGHLLDERPIIEEFFARDLFTLDRVEANFLLCAALAADFGGVVEREVNCEPAGAGVGVATVERAGELLAVDDVVALPDLGFADDRLLADGFLASAFD